MAFKPQYLLVWMSSVRLYSAGPAAARAMMIAAGAETVAAAAVVAAAALEGPQADAQRRPRRKPARFVVQLYHMLLVRPSLARLTWPTFIISATPHRQTPPDLVMRTVPPRYSGYSGNVLWLGRRISHKYFSHRRRPRARPQEEPQWIKWASGNIIMPHPTQIKVRAHPLFASFRRCRTSRAPGSSSLLLSAARVTTRVQAPS